MACFGKIRATDDRCSCASNGRNHCQETKRRHLEFGAREARKFVVVGKIKAFAGWLGMVACCAGASFAMAQPQPGAPQPPAWFTVAGDPANERAETVQVELSDFAPEEQGRVMALRVNRAHERRSWDGVPYRSYHALVRFDCRAGRAQYLEIAFYEAPLWQGAVLRKQDYRGNPQPMAFRGMSPNPTERIVRAACRPVG